MAIAIAALLVALAGEPALARPVTVADLLAGSPAQDWRVPDPEQTLYLDLKSDAW